ncbi:SalD [Sulfurifustis variabilis]|uniref:SalD n=2 Tax=Sulfurifustis variabilis TaxID=1675686 RepID=A0A1B4VFL7_9GAMM|nr:SalD [Sulfurifustis variabilis]
MGEVAPGVTLGASYQTEMAMSEFDSYKGLFAEEGGFDIPATATVGLAWNVTPSSTLVFDIQKIWYSKVPSIANPLLPNIGMAPLGADNGAGFGWEDMTIYKLGYQWSTSQAWTWRVGYSMGDQPIPESEVLFNILAPGVVEQHFTFGFTNHLNKNSEWSFAAMYAPEEEVSGPNPLEVPGQQTITLRMDQWELAASYAWKF